MANYEDIAKIAGVSIATISHVINKTRFVSPETEKRVLDVIEKLNYKPNLYARGFATGNTKTLGVIISDIRNPFYPEIVQTIEEEVNANDYNIFLVSIDYNNEVKTRKTIDTLISRKIDGLIITSSELGDSSIREIANYGIPIVFVNWGNSNVNADNIFFYYYSGLKDAVDYLISLGHKRIYFISGPKNLKTSNIRIETFIKAVGEAGIIDYKIFEGNHRPDGGYKAANTIVSGNVLPTAVICSNDMTAIGAIQLFTDKNIDVPRDISVIGIDNIELTHIIKPSITTIDLDRPGAGKILVDLLLARLNEKDLPFQKVCIKTKLIKRETTAIAKNYIR